jgi:nitroreductase
VSSAAANSAVLDPDTVQAALAVAVRAPSIHNTQPWRWQLRPDGLVLLADRSRQLSVADPDGHSLLVSCGAALALTELALQAAGWRLEVRRLPDPAEPDVLAVFAPLGHDEPDPALAAKVDAALRRHSDRRPFRSGEVPAEVIETLRFAANSAFVHADFPLQEDQRINLAVAVSWADRMERNDEEYLAEVRRWVRDPEVNAEASADGVVTAAVPHVSMAHPRRTDVPLRDFEVGVTGRQLIQRDVDERPLIAVLLSESDRPEEQLEAGEAMMRLMVQAELLGLASCPLSQAVDLAAFRTRIQGLMGWVGHPQMMLRIGYPGVGDVPATPRRPVSAVLDVVG